MKGIAIMKRILALLLIAATMLSFVSCKKDKEETPDDENGNKADELTSVDFLKDDLAEYVEIDEKYYKNYTVTIDSDRVALDVENKIIQELCKQKSKESVKGDGVISVGDVAHIYYKGYYMKDGEPYYFDGGCNMDSGKPHALEIGSGGFIPGFEYNLIGKNPADYTKDNPIVVETFFPENYSSAELRGKTAYFIVEVEELVEYDAPSLDVTFITETLKLSAETLEEYEGEGIVQKYRSYLKEQIAVEKGLDTDTLVLQAFWKSVMAGAVVKKYPEKQVEEAYDSLVAELEYYYDYYSSYYKYDDFMCLYIGLDVGSDWKAELKNMAKDQVKQQLIFYRIMNQEGLKPTDEEYNKLFDEYLVSALADQGIVAEKYDTEEEYLTAKSNFKKQMLESRGEEYFKTMIYYQVTVEKIIEYANVVETTK